MNTEITYYAALQSKVYLMLGKYRQSEECSNLSQKLAKECLPPDDPLQTPLVSGIKYDLYEGHCKKCDKDYWVIIWNKFQELTKKQQECIYCSDEVDNEIVYIDYKRTVQNLDSYL